MANIFFIFQSNCSIEGENEPHEEVSRELREDDIRDSLTFEFQNVIRVFFVFERVDQLLFPLQERKRGQDFFLTELRNRSDHHGTNVRIRSFLGYDLVSKQFLNVLSNLILRLDRIVTSSKVLFDR